MSVRTDLIDELKRTIEEISIVNTVEKIRPTPQDIEVTTLPVVYIYAGPSINITATEMGVIGQETYDWTIILEGFVDENTEVETLLYELHKALFANQTLDDKAIYCNIMSTDILEAITSDKAFNGIMIEYHVLYKHAQGQP